MYKAEKKLRVSTN